jgi:4-cresol dehydrogenase (hydroxylating)
MANAKLTEEPVCTWPGRFGSWAERSPDARALCGSERLVPWRLRPPTVQDVITVVREAAREGTALWPVSRGMNWGYGSHLPARDGAVIVDLGALDSISGLDRATQSVRIGPGVTQAALHAFLRRHAPDLAPNVTGAGAGTSILGNALERGVGYSGERDREVYALEVVLADGTLVGPSPGLHHPSRQHPAGLSTDALFFQTGLGIVVGARLRLRVRQQSEEAVIVQGDFAGVLGTLKRAYEAQLLVHPAHIAEPGRTRRLGFGLLRSLWGRNPTDDEVGRCFPERSVYTGLAPLCGRRRVVAAAWKEIKGLAAPGLKLTRVSSEKMARAALWLGRLGMRHQAARLLAIRPIVGFAWGEPSDAGLTSLDGYEGGNPDGALRGAIYGNAALAVDAADAGRVGAAVRGHWPDCAFTWIVLGPASMLAIYTLHFDRAESAAAQAAAARVAAALREAGFPPYRLGISGRVAPGNEAIARAVKAALDPKGILSPGRYES